MKTSKPRFATPAAVEEAFYDAMARGDLQGLMSLWAEDDEIVCVHPGGPRTTGVRAVRRAWASVLTEQLDIRARSIRRYETMTTAVTPSQKQDRPAAGVAGTIGRLLRMRETGLILIILFSAKRQIVLVNIIGSGKHHAPLYYIHELPDVSGPSILHEGIQDIICNTIDPFAEFCVKETAEVYHQQLYILWSFP